MLQIGSTAQVPGSKQDEMPVNIVQMQQHRSARWAEFAFLLFASCFVIGTVRAVVDFSRGGFTHLLPYATGAAFGSLLTLGAYKAWKAPSSP